MEAAQVYMGASRGYIESCRPGRWRGAPVGDRVAPAWERAVPGAGASALYNHEPPLYKREGD